MLSSHMPFSSKFEDVLKSTSIAGFFRHFLVVFCYVRAIQETFELSCMSKGKRGKEMHCFL